MERYSSGSSLERTDKEQSLDALERMLCGDLDWSDEFYNAMKKLNHDTIRILNQEIADTISEIHAKCKKPTKG